MYMIPDARKKRPAGRWWLLVARTGFEPVASALRGRRPGPLDERAFPPAPPFSGERRLPVGDALASRRLARQYSRRWGA